LLQHPDEDFCGIPQVVNSDFTASEVTAAYFPEAYTKEILLLLLNSAHLLKQLRKRLSKFQQCCVNYSM